MKTVINILLYLIIFTTTACAQTVVSKKDQKPIIEKIEKTSSTMKSMQCDFVQTKTMKMLSKKMVSSGVMYFKRKDKLRWQYKTPYYYTFLMNGDNVKIKSAKNTQNIKVQNNKMFRQITNVIIGSITGGTLKDSQEFKAELIKTGNNYSVRLTPKKKEIKHIFNTIEIFFNAGLTMVRSVRMVEKTGDVTVVELKNVKVNATISDNIFSLN